MGYERFRALKHAQACLQKLGIEEPKERVTSKLGVLLCLWFVVVSFDELCMVAFGFLSNLPWQEWPNYLEIIKKTPDAFTKPKMPKKGKKDTGHLRNIQIYKMHVLAGC